MSDGIKFGLSQIGADVREAVVKPVTDEVGKAIEEGAQSVVGVTAKPVDPMVQQKKQEEELKKKQWAIQTIQRYKQIDEAQKKVREEKKQKEFQETQKEEEQKKVKQYELIKKRQERLPQQVAEAQRRTEVKKGVGG